MVEEAKVLGCYDKLIVASLDDPVSITQIVACDVGQSAVACNLGGLLRLRDWFVTLSQLA